MPTRARINASGPHPSSAPRSRLKTPSAVPVITNSTFTLLRNSDGCPIAVRKLKIHHQRHNRAVGPKARNAPHRLCHRLRTRSVRRADRDDAQPRQRATRRQQAALLQALSHRQNTPDPRWNRGRSRRTKIHTRCVPQWRWAICCTATCAGLILM